MTDGKNTSKSLFCFHQQLSAIGFHQDVFMCSYILILPYKCIDNSHLILKTFIFNKLSFWDLNSDFAYYLCQCSDLFICLNTSLLCAQGLGSWLLNYLVSYFIVVKPGICLRRQTSQYTHLPHFSVLCLPTSHIHFYKYTSLLYNFMLYVYPPPTLFCDMYINLYLSQTFL